MMKKEGYKVVREYIKQEKYERLTMSKLIAGRSISEAIDEALDHGRPPK